jgi:hypothetical protein
MDDTMFMKTVQKVLLSYRSPGPCPDQFVGEIMVDRNRVSNPAGNARGSDFARRENVPPWERQDGPVVILIIESPHTAEFEGDIGPAKGKTGETIRALFGQACDLRQCLENGSYPLVLVNAIQYQCSLACPTRCYRDKVFHEVWNHGGKSDFMSRIKALYVEGDVIINACTAGSMKPRNWELVRDTLKEMNLVAARVEHPANWARRQNTAKKQGQCPKYGWRTSC